MEKTEFGAFVSKNRKELGMTQKALAERLHVTDKAVSKWERGLSFPDVTLLEPLAGVFGMGVTELLSCREAASGPPAAGENPAERADTPEVLRLLDISGESLHRERARGRRWVAALTLLLLAALAALGILLGRSSVTETGSLMVLHREETEKDVLLYVEKEGSLLRLSYTGTQGERQALEERLSKDNGIMGEYRWNYRTRRGRLLSWQGDTDIPIGGPMDEVGSATDLYAWDGDALFGYPRVLVRILNRQPNPGGSGYLSTYAFYLGDDSADWYRHADEELLRAFNCLGYGGYGDGGYRTADMDGDGIRELLVRTPWPEKPCILYDLTEEGVTETWLDELPEELAGSAG